MKSLIIALLLFAVKSSAQSGEIGPLPIAPPTYDTIPCHLLYRTKAGQVGIVKGWEVMRASKLGSHTHLSDGTVYLYQPENTLLTYKHITYLLANRRRFPKGTEVWKLEEPIKQ